MIRTPEQSHQYISIRCKLDNIIKLFPNNTVGMDEFTGVNLEDFVKVNKEMGPVSYLKHRAYDSLLALNKIYLRNSNRNPPQ